MEADEDTRYYCTKCSLYCPTYKAWAKHIRQYHYKIHTGQPCPNSYCDYMTNNKGNMKAHLKICIFKSTAQRIEANSKRQKQYFTVYHNLPKIVLKREHKRTRFRALTLIPVKFSKK